MAETSAPQNERSNFSPRDLLRVLRDHWLVVVGCVALGVLLASLWTLTQPRTYQSHASAVVTAGVNENLGIALTADNLAKSKATQYQELATSRAVAEGAVKQAGLDISPEAASGAVTVTVPPDTAEVRLSVVQDSPDAARALADAWVSSLAEEVSNIENQTLPGVEQSEESSAQSIVKVHPLVQATQPQTPHTPNVRMALALGALVGLVVGLGVAALRSLNDRRIRGVKVLEETFGLTVLGTIPAMAGLGRRAQRNRAQSKDSNAEVESRSALLELTGHTGRDDFHVVEAFKELRTNLQFLRPDNPPRIIVVTSAAPAEGKSTVAANAAITLAQSDVPTVLVDADLRRPTVAGSFHVEGSVGLTNAVVGNAQVDDVLQPVSEVENLTVLASGPVPPNPSEILGSDRLEAILRSLAQDHMVIVDAPPLLPVTDAAILAAKYDGCVLVVTAGRTTRDELAKSLGNLAKVNGDVLGTVLNRVPTRGKEAGYYGYYGKSYYSSSPTTDQDFDVTRRNAGSTRE